jgi:hypothetical protein
MHVAPKRWGTAVGCRCALWSTTILDDIVPSLCSPMTPVEEDQCWLLQSRPVSIVASNCKYTRDGHYRSLSCQTARKNRGCPLSWNFPRCRSPFSRLGVPSYELVPVFDICHRPPSSLVVADLKGVRRVWYGSER